MIVVILVLCLLPLPSFAQTIDEILFEDTLNFATGIGTDATG